MSVTLVAPPDRLTVTQEVAVVRCVVGGHLILSVAQCETLVEATKTLKCGTSCGGGSDGGMGVGGYSYDSKGIVPALGNTGWSLSWQRAAEIVRAGLTPGALAHLMRGYRTYCELHYGDWQRMNALQDPVAYSTCWRSTYSRSSRQMREAEDYVWETALGALMVSEPPAQLGLFG